MAKTIFAFLCAAMLVFCAAGCRTNASAVSSASEPVPASKSADIFQSPAAEPVIPEPPDNSWQFDDPKNQGVDGELLAELHGAIKDTQIYSIVTVKNGFIIDEYYKDGYDENSVFRLASCTKSFSGALVGIAIDKGLLEGVDMKLTEFFPQLELSDEEYKRDITIEHLLTHTSGLYWSEWSGGPMFGQLVRSENWVDFVLGQPMASEPGAVFNYSTGGSHLLGAVIQEATGESAYEFARENLFKPLGMDSVTWSSDPQGITDGGNGISMSARDAAKFGRLYLDGGKWKDRQIISEEWVAQSTRSQSSGSAGTGEYGYSWWIKAFGGNRAYDTYYAMGHGGQYIFVVPELRLVTVITGRFQDTYTPQYYFSDYIIPACG